MENGGSFISEKLKVSKTSYGLGIFASTEIEEDEILLQIPQKILIGLNFILRDKEFIASVEARAHFFANFLDSDETEHDILTLKKKLMQISALIRK